MLRKTQQLRERFRDTHFSKMAVHRGIFAGDGEQVGFIDRIEFRNGRLRVQGWVSSAALVTLEFGGLTRSSVPVLPRVDVAQKTGLASQLGFDISISLTAGQFCAMKLATLRFEPRGDGPQIEPMVIEFKNLWRAKARSDAQFVMACFKAGPPALRWLAKRAPQDRAKVLEALALNPIAVTSEFSSALFDVPVSVAMEPEAQIRITIILPVYNAFELLPDVLGRIVRNTDTPYHLIILEDVSSDANVRPYLRNWVETAGAEVDVTLVENETNLGFIGSVNKALAIAQSSDVPGLAEGCAEGPLVLLNSDAFVPQGWATRLIAPLLADPNVASSTPLSNDAEIMSVPIQCQRSDLSEGDADKLDSAAAKLNAQTAQAIVPTGVGFCMAMARTWVAQVPQLDTVFGRGYGEEVDWCQKVRALGGHHVAIGNLFVEHRGGSSFGSADKLAMITKNNGIVSARYPTYDAEVQDFIATDPLLSPRIALAVAWAGVVANGRLPIYIAHSLGGGAETALIARLESDLDEIGAAIVLRVGGTRQWHLEVLSPDGKIYVDIEETDVILSLIAQLEQRHIIYSCGVGAADPVALPAMLQQLFDPATDRLSILVHDFFMVSPSYTLLGTDGVYCGPVLSNRADAMHTARASDGALVSVSEWQANWYALLKQANSIEVFSNNSAEILRELWPDLASSIDIKPHHLPHQVDRVTHSHPELAKTIGVLGGINFAKGAAVVEQIAKDAPDLNIVIVGKVDPSFTMPSNVTIHGAYAPKDIASLAKRYQIGQWLIPSIWPETFSFTAHEALATGLPVIAFGLGAQADVLAASPNGIVVPFDTSTPQSTGSLATSMLNQLKQSEQ